MLERRYISLTGGRPFPKTTSTLKEVTWLGQPQPPAQGGLLGGSGATWGTFTSMAEVEYGDIFLNWRDMSRNGPAIRNLTCYGYQLLFSYFSGSQEPTNPTILGD